MLFIGKAIQLFLKDFESAPVIYNFDESAIDFC